MKVQVLPVIATCLAGADAAALGPRATWNFNLGNLFGGVGGGTSGNTGLNVQALQDGLQAITKTLNEAANPTKGSGWFGLFPPQVPAALTGLQLYNDISQVNNAIATPQRLLDSVKSPQIPSNAQDATCTIVIAVLDAEKALVSKINSALGGSSSTLAKDLVLPLVGRVLGQSSDGIDSLIDRIVKIVPNCQAPVDESERGLAAAFTTLVTTARSLPGLFGSGFVSALLEYITVGSNQPPNPPPSSSLPSLPSITPPPVPSLSTRLPGIPSPTISLPPVPPISLPPIPSLSLPPISLPSVSLPPIPSLSLPISLPLGSLPPIPSLSVPPVSLPSPVLPSISLPPIPGISEPPTIPSSLISIPRPSSTGIVLPPLPPISSPRSSSSSSRPPLPLPSL